MSTGTEQAADPGLNGQAPPPAPDDAGEAGPVTAGERVMGLVGIAFAVGLLAIGLDLVTGGAVARLLGGLGGERSAGDGG